MSEQTVWVLITDSDGENGVTVHDSWESAAVLARDFIKRNWSEDLGEIPENVEEALRVLWLEASVHARIESHVPLTVEESQRVVAGGAQS